MASDGTIGTAASAATGAAGLSYWEMIQRVGDFMGVGRSPSGDGLARVREVIEDGYERFLYPVISEGDRVPHRWTFLAPLATFDLVIAQWEYDAPSDFGYFISKPTYPASSGVLPLHIDVIGELAIRERRALGDSSGDPTVIAVVPKAFTRSTGQRFGFQVWPTPATGYTLTYRYAMAANGFAVVIADGTGTFATTTVAYDSITEVGATFLADGVAAGDKVIIKSSGSDADGIYTVSSVPSETTIKCTATISTEAGTCEYEVLDDAVYALGGRTHSQALLEIILGVAEERYDAASRVHRDLADRLLTAAVRRDRMHSPETVGVVDGAWLSSELPVEYVPGTT